LINVPRFPDCEEQRPGFTGMQTGFQLYLYPAIVVWIWTLRDLGEPGMGLYLIASSEMTRPVRIAHDDVFLELQYEDDTVGEPRYRIPESAG
jgi:hypothetical protein